ncbi:PREDICTED: uncharacterized protein LOC109151229 [Ipomoea nil]|uniref:uncharacterized protein LOC109151229 n=1 Tax=Ipomoea nil TaxID=35883 RepID=UPI000900A276|nr:PREDICTED: uncharacterized protein LOC109151229 [Ipomoea nil]
MIWSIPSPMNSLNSFNEYSYHITGSTSQPVMAQIENAHSTIPPTSNPPNLSPIEFSSKHYSGISTSQGKRSNHTNQVEVVANKSGQEGSLQSIIYQGLSTNTPNNNLPEISSASMPIMNGLYDPQYQEFGLPVDPHLRCLMLNPNFMHGQVNPRFSKNN